MIIVTSYKVGCKSGSGGSEDGEESGKYTIIMVQAAIPPCPICGGVLLYRDSRARNSIDYHGETRSFMLRRLRCEQCGKLHTEIPDIIQPFKHYDSEAIQMVIDEEERAESCVADMSTMCRWKRDMAEASPDISQRVASTIARENDEAVPVMAADKIMCWIKKRRLLWLGFVMALLINNGHKLCTRFAFCPFPSPDRVSVEAERNGGKGRKNVEEVKDSG